MTRLFPRRIAALLAVLSLVALACGGAETSDEHAPASPGQVKQELNSCHVTVYDQTGQTGHHITFTQTAQPTTIDLYQFHISYFPTDVRWNNHVRSYSVTGGCAFHLGNSGVNQECAGASDCADENLAYSDPFSQNATSCEQSTRYLTISDVCKP
jgi:hypothetical protein